MTWFEVAQYINTILGAVLIARLINLDHFRVYTAFCCFLIFELLQSFIFIFVSKATSLNLDYRTVWIFLRIIAWGLTLWTVYALLSAVLKTLPGILKFSRNLLNVVFVGAVVLGVVTTGPSLQILKVNEPLMNRAVEFTMIFERAFTMSAFIALLAILFFIIWFPIKIPRNLVVFSVGLVVFLSTKICLLLVRTYFTRLSHDTIDLISGVNTAVLSVCFLCWAALISQEGQRSTVQIGHSWEVREQERLVIQLETMNATLLQSRANSPAR